MSCDLNDAALDGGLAALRERSADWLLIHYAVNVKDTLQLKASGSNGLEELKVQLRQYVHEAQFGLLCLEGKTLLFNVIPENIGGVKRARAVVHTTALRNRASGLPVATTLSVSSPSDLTISAVRAKLRLSPVPALNTPLPQTPPDLTGLPGALPAGLPPLPPKDVPPSPRQVATPGSSHSGTSNYFATDALDNGPLSSTSDKHHVEHAPKSLSLTGEVAPLKSRKRTPSPINIPTTNIPDTQRTRSATSQVENEVHSPSFMSYLQHGTAPSSPVNSKHSTQASQHQPPSPLQQSSVVSDQLNTGAPSPQAHSIIESYSQRDAIEEQPIQPPDLVHPGQRGGIQRSASDEIKEQYQRQSSVTVTESPTSRPKDQRTSQSSHSSLSPPVRSSSLDHSLSATASTHFSSKTHEEAPRIETLSGPSRSRGLSNASSANASPVVDNYSESISTSITSATGDSSSSALASSHKKSRDAALTAELQRQDAWEADEPRRKLLPMAEQVALERNELERRAAAERQRREIRWHNAMAQQEVMAAEDAERQAQEQVEREAQELKLQKEREARAEQVRIEAEQKKQEAARQKAAKQEELRQRLQQLSADTKEVMLDGFVSVQNPNSTLWRRRWFQLRKGRLSLFKSPEDTLHPVSTIDLNHSARLGITDGFEETMMANSFIVQYPDDDATAFYCDEEADKELLTEALKVASNP